MAKRQKQVVSTSPKTKKRDRSKPIKVSNQVKLPKYNNKYTKHCAVCGKRETKRNWKQHWKTESHKPYKRKKLFKCPIDEDTPVLYGNPWRLFKDKAM